MASDGSGLTSQLGPSDKKQVDDEQLSPPDTDAQVEGVGTEAGAGLIGEVVADRYRVERLLGEGAMGAVYLAQHVHMQKAVALKVLHKGMSQNPEVVRRFEREAIAAGRIEHPHVAGASDFGRLGDGSFYMVLEYIDGKSLGQLMEESGPMAPERACRIAAQIASALSAAHTAGIVHRDLKPENVMMPQSDAEAGDLIKVLDFGMAKLQQTDNTETKLTMHGAIYGTPQYMAPEQAAGQEVDHRADLYALGLMLYEMLSGRCPFNADNMMTLLVKHMTEAPPPLPVGVPADLSRLVTRCLEKKPEDRPQSADEFLEGLSAVFGPLQADPRLSAVGIPMPQAPGVPRAEAPSVVAMKVAGKVAPWVERMIPLYEKVTPLIEWGRAGLSQALTFLQGSMTVAGRSFPRWVPAAGLFGGALVLVLLTTGGEDEPSSFVAAPVQKAPAGRAKTPSQKTPKADPHPPDPELAKVIVSAERGSESALYALEQRDDDERSLTEWLGLTKARLMNKKVRKGLESFKEAIEMEPTAKLDEDILGALRFLADKEEYAEPIIEFLADEMGAVGADMLFHIWAKTSLKTTSTTLAFEKLESSAVQDRFSKALRVAMDLRDAETCEDYKKILPTIEDFGDERTLTKLRPLLKRRGCGTANRGDCYPCLKKRKELEAAMQAAAMRKAPRFPLGGFKFKR